jgi:hypothetical protein
MKAERNVRSVDVALCSLKKVLIAATTVSLGFTLMSAHLKKAMTMSKFNQPTSKDEAYNHVESMNRVKKAFDEEMQMRAKTQQEFYDELRNGVIEEVAMSIERMRGFGGDTISSFAIYIRRMKK